MEEDEEDMFRYGLYIYICMYGFYFFFVYNVFLFIIGRMHNYIELQHIKQKSIIKVIMSEKGKKYLSYRQIGGGRRQNVLVEKIE